MGLRENLSVELKAAMIAKDSNKVNTIRFLQSAIKNREIELRPNAISEEDVMGVVKKMIKQRKESIDQFQQANRQDLVDKEVSELKILEAYLPAQMTAEQVSKLVAEVISAVGATSAKDMGKVMKEVLARSGGTADGKLVSEAVKAKLQ